VRGVAAAELAGERRPAAGNREFGSVDRGCLSSAVAGALILDEAMRQPLAIAVGAAAVLVVGLAFLDRAGREGRGWPSGSLRDLTKLTPLDGIAAPAFTLSDQHGRTVSLASLRGRIVVLESMDPECTLECPITSQQFIEAAHALGERSSEVVFVGVNVNQYHAGAADVLRFSRVHRLERLPNWHFLTGSTSALRRVWQAYRIIVRPSRTGDVAHTDAMYFIDRRGRARWVAAPEYDKAAIPQWGAAIADIANHLLGVV
jgi:cytochrome oxidase Cu insertion factor (SCO1/SenC/PrrC family)